jgi:hypothetical protein
MTLSTFAQITDYADEAGTRPLEQYQGKPRLLALLLSFVNRCQELENAAWDVIIKRMIDNAHDAQLDTIGKIVGQLRGAQADDIYRIYITARIRINRSQGHPDDVIDVLRLVDAATFTYTEFYPATAVVEYASAPTADPQVLAALARLAISAGVRFNLIAQSQTNDFLLGDDTVGGQVDTQHGLSDEAESTGGCLAGIW